MTDIDLDTLAHVTGGRLSLTGVKPVLKLLKAGAPAAEEKMMGVYSALGHGPARMEAWMKPRAWLGHGSIAGELAKIANANPLK